MHTSKAAVKLSLTHWNVNGSIATTSKLVVSIATYSPGGSETRHPRSSPGPLFALRRASRQTFNRIVDETLRSSGLFRLPAKSAGNSNGSPLSRANRLATLARNCILRTSERSANSCASATIAARSRSSTAWPTAGCVARPSTSATSHPADQLAALVRELPHRVSQLGRLRLQPIPERGLLRLKPRARLARTRARRIARAVPEPRLVQMPQQHGGVTQLNGAQRASVHEHRPEPQPLTARFGGRLGIGTRQHEPDRRARRGEAVHLSARRPG